MQHFIFYLSFYEGINHGDFNDLNVLVQPDESDGYKISGILDFGDMSSGYYIHDLAITIMYMMNEHPCPPEVGGPILAGWESVFPLNEAEKDCLFILVLCRFCQSLVFARYSVTLQPENAEYLMISSRKGIHVLHQLWELGKEYMEKVWFHSAAQFSDRKWEIYEESYFHTPLYENSFSELKVSVIWRSQALINTVWYKWQWIFPESDSI